MNARPCQAFWMVFWSTALPIPAGDQVLMVVLWWEGHCRACLLVILGVTPRLLPAAPDPCCAACHRMPLPAFTARPHPVDWSLPLPASCTHACLLTTFFATLKFQPCLHGACLLRTLAFPVVFLLWRCIPDIGGFSDGLCFFAALLLYLDQFGAIHTPAFTCTHTLFPCSTPATVTDQMVFVPL